MNLTARSGFNKKIDDEKINQIVDGPINPRELKKRTLRYQATKNFESMNQPSIVDEKDEFGDVSVSYFE